MALDQNYVYRYRCSDYGGLICEANFRDFDPLTDAWVHTNSADCRAAERMGILVGSRPNCRGRGRVSGGKGKFLGFSMNEMNTKQKVVLGSSAAIGAIAGYKFIKVDKVLGTTIGILVGVVIGNSLVQTNIIK